ncbi:MAG TPA: PEGA domain-containing protein, partial [Polyangiaceae bacterium]
GDHVVVAKAQGYGDATKTVAIVSGDKDVVAQLDLMPAAAGTALGSLHVHSNLATATIAIDGVALANGTWEGGLPAGKHHVEAHAEGQPTWSRDIDVAPNQRVDLEATIGADASTPPVPPAYDESGKPVPPKKPEERHWYLMGGLGLFTSVYTVHNSAFDGIGGARDGRQTEYGFNGLALNLRGGREFGKFVSIEVFAEVGGLKPVSWPVSGSDKPADVTITYFQLGPEFRVHSPGKVLRIEVGTGLAIEGVSVAQNNVKPSGGSSKGSGAEAAWVVEAGPQLRFADRFFVEADLFMNLSGDGNINEGGNRYFYDSPVVREGVRAFFGFTL